MSPSRSQVQQPPSATHATARRTDQPQPSTFSEWELVAFDPTPALIAQPKLRVSEPGDPYEREADRIASALVGSSGAPEELPRASPLGVVHRASAGGGGGVPVSPAVEGAIGSARGGGRPLPSGIQEPMEQALGSDLSHVRIHTGSGADSLNRSLEARAFTTGRDIFFESGSYSPGTAEGRHLLAHELTHVVQQGGGSGSGAVQRSPAANLIQRTRKRRQRESESPPKDVSPSKALDDETEETEEELEKRRTARDTLKRQRRPTRPKPRQGASTFEAPTPADVDGPGFSVERGNFVFTPSVVSKPVPFSGFSSFTPQPLPLSFGGPEPSSFSGFGPFGSLQQSSQALPVPPLETNSFSLSGFGGFGQPSSSLAFSAPQPGPGFGPKPFLAPRAPVRRSRVELAPGPSGFDFVYSDDEDVESWTSAAPSELPQLEFDLFSSESERARKAEQGEKAVAVIKDIAANVTDTQELASYFPWLAETFGMQWIRLADLGTPNARVAFRINPSFEIKLVGTELEMRAEGSGTGSGGAAAKTRVAWKSGKLNLGGTDYVVGKNMLANPLSVDHPQGSGSQADKDQKWMSNVPSASGATENGYVKGHLLNDNLGGIANEKNLFPITGFANKQHLANAEQYIKTGVDNGYVYAYRVDVGNVTTGPIATTAKYWVDADLYFEFARLDATGKEVKGTYHKGTVKSRYGKREADPFPKGTDRQTEFGQDYTGGKPSAPKLSAKGSGTNVEQTSTGSQKAPATSNAGLAKVLGPTDAFTYKEPDAFGTSPFGVAPVVATPQSINPAPTYEPKLSLKKSVQAKVEAQFASIVTGWKASDITNWVNELRGTPAIKNWSDVEVAAVKHNLDAPIAATIFAAGGQGRTKTTINGAS